MPLTMFSSVALGLAFVASVICAAPEMDIPKLTLPGDCPEFKGMSSLEISKIEGDWFALYSFEKGIEEKEKCHCLKENVKLKPDGTVETIFTAVMGNEPINMTVSSTPLKDHPSVFAINPEPFGHGTITITSTIIDTDYTDHLVAATCSTIENNHGYMIVVYGRKKMLPTDKMAMITDHLKQFDNIQDPLIPIDQNC